MTSRANINFNYKGEDYSIKGNQFFDIGEGIEEFIELSDVMSGKYKVSSLCRSFDVILKAFGVNEELIDIKTEFYNDGYSVKMVDAITRIIVPIALPPESVSKHAKKPAAKKKRAPKKA